MTESKKKKALFLKRTADSDEQEILLLSFGYLSFNRFPQDTSTPKHPHQCGSVSRQSYSPRCQAPNQSSVAVQAAHS